MASKLATNPSVFSGIVNAASDLDNTARGLACTREQAALDANATVMSADELTSLESVCNALRGRGQRHVLTTLLEMYDRPKNAQIGQDERWAIDVAGATRS